MKVCNDYRLLINLYIDGALDADEARRVEAHLSSCPACRRYCDEICMVNRAVQEVAIPKELHTSIMAAVSAEMAHAQADANVTPFSKAAPAAQPVQKKRRPRRWIGTAAAMLAIACVGVFGMDGGLTSIFSGMGSKAESADAAQESVMETETMAPGNGLKSMQNTARSEITAESAPETPEAADGETLPIRIEEAMTGWFTDAEDHVQVVECGAPMRMDGAADLPAKEGGEDGPVLDDGMLNELDALLGEAADGFGFCMVAAGSSEDLPDVFADQAGETAPGFTLVITVRNDAAVHKQIDASLSKAGFALWEDTDGSRFALDPAAEEGLVVVVLTE